MPRVLVNDRPLYATGTGVAMYLRNLIRHWPSGAAVELEGFISHCLRRRRGWPAPAAENGEIPSPDGARSSPATPLELRPLSRLGAVGALKRRVPHPVRRVVQKAYATSFRATARRHRYDAVWEPNHLAVPCRPPVVATMHDLSVLEHPEWHPVDRVRQWEHDLPVAVRAAAAWLVPSAFTRTRMIEVLGVPEDRIHVTPLGARALPRPGADALAAALAQRAIPTPYALALGTIEPRKNLPILLDAWQSMPPVRRQGCRLILAGAAGWGAEAFWRRLVEHPVADEVLVTGYVDDATAGVLLAGAAAVLLPSWYEGFGLPILEAMAAGSLVVCSDIPVFREVAGAAAAYAAPGDAAAWADAARRAIDDPSWATSLVAAGDERWRTFAWEKAADRTAGIFAAVAGRRVPV